MPPGRAGAGGRTISARGREGEQGLKRERESKDSKGGESRAFTSVHETGARARDREARSEGKRTEWNKGEREALRVEDQSERDGASVVARERGALRSLLGFCRRILERSSLRTAARRTSARSPCRVYTARIIR